MTPDAAPGYLFADDCRLANLIDLVSQKTDLADYRYAAHTDMPAETGPTMYLPHSHKYLPRYLAWRQPDFREYFEAHHVQLPLRKGDAVFFNPAVFHAAGANRTADVRRMANLLQVSSAFGRAMEVVDRAAMSAALSRPLQAMADDGASPSSDRQRDRGVRRRLPVSHQPGPGPARFGGLAPPAQADILGPGRGRRLAAAATGDRTRRLERPAPTRRP